MDVIRSCDPCSIPKGTEHAARLCPLIWDGPQDSTALRDKVPDDVDLHEIV